MTVQPRCLSMFSSHIVVTAGQVPCIEWVAIRVGGRPLCKSSPVR